MMTCIPKVRFKNDNPSVASSNPQAGNGGSLAKIRKSCIKVVKKVKDETDKQKTRGETTSTIHAEGTIEMDKTERGEDLPSLIHLNKEPTPPLLAATSSPPDTNNATGEGDITNVHSAINPALSLPFSHLSSIPLTHNEELNNTRRITDDNDSSNKDNHQNVPNHTNIFSGSSPINIGIDSTPYHGSEHQLPTSSMNGTRPITSSSRHAPPSPLYSRRSNERRHRRAGQTRRSSRSANSINRNATLNEHSGPSVRVESNRPVEDYEQYTSTPLLRELISILTSIGSNNPLANSTGINDNLGDSLLGSVNQTALRLVDLGMELERRRVSQRIRMERDGFERSGTNGHGVGFAEGGMPAGAYSQCSGNVRNNVHDLDGVSGSHNGNNNNNNNADDSGNNDNNGLNNNEDDGIKLPFMIRAAQVPINMKVDNIYYKTSHYHTVGNRAITRVTTS